MSNFVNLLDVVYPVGSIYISYSGTSPASIVGGTWKQLTGVVLRAANDTNTGGSDTTSHSHDIGSGYALIGAINNDTSSLGYKPTGMPSGVSTYGMAIRGASTITPISNMNHCTALYGNTHTSTISNLPAYQDVYVWYRTV